jgi:rRNA-processing protein FCF1
MNDYLVTLVKKYKQRGLLIDTNIILLYIVGSVDIFLIRNFSRTSMFTEDDFHKVSKFIDYFDLKITTPHILTEVSDLIGNRPEFHRFLKVYLKLMSEKFEESIKLSENDAFVKFGLADTAVLEISKDSYLVFTDDKPLYGYLISKGVDAVNLDQLRFILS